MQHKKTLPCAAFFIVNLKASPTASDCYTHLAQIENLTLAPQEMPPLADIKSIPVLDFCWHTACIKPIQ